MAICINEWHHLSFIHNLVVHLGSCRLQPSSSPVTYMDSSGDKSAASMLCMSTSLHLCLWPSACCRQICKCALAFIGQAVEQAVKGSSWAFKYWAGEKLAMQPSSLQTPDEGAAAVICSPSPPACVGHRTSAFSGLGS